MIYVLDRNEQLVTVINAYEESIKGGANNAPLFVASNGDVSKGLTYFEFTQEEEVNGESNVKVVVPANHDDAQYICEGNYLVFKDYDLNWQMYEIKAIEDIHDNDGIVREIYGEHVFYQLLDEVVEDKYQTNGDGTACLLKALEGSSWQLKTVNVTGTQSVHFYYESRLSAIQKVRDAFKAELKFEVTFTGSAVTGKYVSLLTSIGSVTNKQFKFNKDVTSVKRKVDFSNVITACYGRGKGVQVGTDSTGDATYGRRLTFRDVVWTSPTNPANKPANQEWIEDSIAKSKWGRKGNNLFGVFKDDEETDANRLIQKTWDYLQANKDPKVTYDLGVMDLERLTGYSHEAVRLGDTVLCIDEEFRPSLKLSARIIKLKRDYINPENNAVTLGNYRETFEKLFNSTQSTVNKIGDRQGVWDRAGSINDDGTINTSLLEGIINTLQNQIQAGGGCVTITDDMGIMVVNNKDNPTKAMKLTAEGFGIANSKTVGVWNWRTFGTGDGFVADMIVAGVLDGNKAKFDLSNGTFRLGNSDTDYKMKFDGTNLLFGNGAIAWNNLDSTTQANLKGSDSYSIILSNDSVTLPADSNGNVTSLAGASTTVMLYKGTTQKTLTFGVILTSNCNITKDDTAKTVTITSISSSSGYVDIEVKDGTTTIGTKRFSFSLSKQGTQGNTGATGASGTDSYSVLLSNDAVTIPTDSAGNNGVLTGATTSIVLYKGTTLKTPTIGTLVTNGCTASKDDVAKTVSFTSVTADSGYVDIPVLDGSTTVGTKRFSFAKSKQGVQGIQGQTGPIGNTGVSYRPMGAWISTTAYVNNSQYIDTVNYYGTLYYCKVSNTGQLPTNTTYWGVAVSKGDSGLAEVRDGKDLNWTLTNVTKDADGNFKKTGGTTSVWDSQAYTAESYMGGCFVSFVVLNKNQYMMIGLNTDPAKDANYTSIDYAWYPQYGGALGIYENGSSVGTFGTYEVGDVLTITYDGEKIKYWQNGVFKKETVVTINSPLYIDSSFYTITTFNSVGNFHFGEYHSKAPKLDWVVDWVGSANLIKDTSIMTPKLFAGINGGTSASPLLTGIAMGRDVLGGTNATIGIVGYNANAVNFQLNTNGSAVFGKTAGQQFIVNADGSVVTPDITADKIKGGTLTLGGAVNGSGYNGSMKLLDVAGNLLAQMDTTGISIASGSFKIGQRSGGQIGGTVANFAVDIDGNVNMYGATRLWLNYYHNPIDNTGQYYSKLGLGYLTLADVRNDNGNLFELRIKPDTVSGVYQLDTDGAQIRIKTPSGYGNIGAINTGYFHFNTDRPSFWFSTNVAVQGRIYQGASYNEPVWGSGDLALTAGGVNYDISSQNLNNIVKTGFYRGNNLTNAPTVDWYYVIVQNHDSNYCSQIALNFFNNRMWTRVRKHNGTTYVWDNWNVITIGDCWWRKDFTGGGLNGTDTQEGTYLLPSGYQLKMGWFTVGTNSTATYNFPVAFPTAGLTGACGNATDYTTWGNVHYAGMSRTGIIANNPGNTCKVWYIALGY